ncbi:MULTISPECIES: DUF6009 family protein [Streptomyces]|uniref:DUF6009 family protein n=1 Tax=Streptomyces caniscabiei TaxID=2746961 RepID=A0ABU4N787_9ACTN|nr:DUF6009 family protein [Streptomyces caniscabiei]MBE4741600.1 transcription factor [Streptomyces caniscabiei]MBE4761978.1 transcription factor [Streptomyces caniscabiei]MBE4775248.1 transcription factor [Streptomyces caniscabiei]MBE4790376.1 transcription factor [Streptomyces caniscabiei]MBE4799633.1 transcription factor [Streptomyces caniscabiei]
MSSLLNESDLTHEEQVVWLEDPENLDYVRQALDKTRRRNTKPPYARDGRMVGYALLDDQAEPDPDSGLYKRRVFFLLPHDRDSLPGGLYREGAPGEAVDPRTIEVKKVGEKTPRSQSGPGAITGSRS